MYEYKSCLDVYQKILKGCAFEDYVSFTGVCYEQGLYWLCSTLVGYLIR